MGKVRGLVLVLFALSLVGCDHATKQLAVSHFQADPIELFRGGVLLTYAENRDMAFNLLGPVLGEQARFWLLSGIKSLAVLAGVVFLLRRRTPARTTELFGVALLVAGALGNLIDRLLRGFVVDFVKVPYWPVFNVADVAICVGVVVLGWVYTREPRAAEVVKTNRSSW